MADGMKPKGVRYDLLVEQGSDFDLPLTWKDENQDPINNTGFTFKLQARDVDTRELVIDIASPTNITIGGADGKIAIHINDTDTADYKFTIARYNLEYTAPGQDVERLMYGYVRLSEDVAP